MYCSRPEINVFFYISGHKKEGDFDIKYSNLHIFWHVTKDKFSLDTVMHSMNW